MGTIQERRSADGKISYRVQVRLKGYPAQTATFQRKTDARKWEQHTEAAIREGRHFKTSQAKKHTLANLIDRYMLEVLPNKPKSRTGQARQLNWWRDRIGAYTLADVTPGLIAEYRNKLAGDEKKARAPATVVRYLAALSHPFTIAVREWNWLESNPVLNVARPKEPRGRVRFLSDDERKRLLAACRDSSCPHLYAVVVLALSIGMRQGEIMNTRWPDVDFHRARIILHDTKNGERRAVPLVGHALAVLSEHTKAKRIDTDLLFPGKDPRRPVFIRVPWLKALRSVEIRDFRFHDLRHSAASYLAMNGASVAEIAEILGHKTLAMVKRYAHLSEGHTAHVVAEMNRRIFADA